MDTQQRAVVRALGFCGLVSAADNWFVSPALPAIAHSLQIAPTAAAIILTAYLIPYGGLQPVCGSLGDRLGRLRLLRIIMLGLTVGTVLCAFAPNLALLTAARIITGCFAAGIITVSQALVSDVVSHEQRAAAVGKLMGITFAGQGISSGVGGMLSDLVGWRAAFIFFGIMGSLAWIGLLKMNKAALQELAHKAGHTMQNRASKTTKQHRSFFVLATHIFFGRGRAIFITAASTGLIYLGVYGFMGTFLAQRCALFPTQAGLVMMFYGIACLLGGNISGHISKAHGLAATIALGEVCGLGALALLGLSTASESWVFSLGAAACLGLGYILVQPTLVSLSMDADPVNAGLCSGLIGFAVFVGGGIGSAVGKTLITSGGFSLLWLCATGTLALQLVLSYGPLKAWSKLR